MLLQAGPADAVGGADGVTSEDEEKTGATRGEERGEGTGAVF